MAREFRSLAIPEGVDGERIDTALTRVIGLSRTVIARLLESGDITSHGKTEI
jgi:23S rRNA pseudouridine1911/1915/1917 synthase